MGELTDTYKILVSKAEGKDYTRDLSVDGRIILKFIFMGCE
jgi:hypothetical protein